MKKLLNFQFRTPPSDFFGNWKLKIGNSTKGFSLVEMLFYIAILALSLVAVLQTLLVVMRSYGLLRNAQHIEQDATLSLERMYREIRDANAVTDAGSTFGAHPGKLLLATADALGAPRTVEFLLDNGKLSLKENGVVSGLLTSTSTSVSNLVFRKITTPRSTGVKIEMTIETGASASARSEIFYGTAVLRDSY